MSGFWCLKEGFPGEKKGFSVGRTCFTWKMILAERFLLRGILDNYFWLMILELPLRLVSYPHHPLSKSPFHLQYPQKYQITFSPQFSMKFHAPSTENNPMTSWKYSPYPTGYSLWFPDWTKRNSISGLGDGIVMI